MTSISVDTGVTRIRPGRPIEGIFAVLLPFKPDGRLDYDGLATHVERTSRSGLIPAINMGTGYVHLLTDVQRAQVLDIARQVLAGRPVVAGAFVEGKTGPLVERHRREIATIEAHGGTPFFFQCSELKGLNGPEVVAIYQQASVESPRLLVFELGEMFAPFGQIYDTDTVRGIMEIENIVGIKHSSLNRQLEWERLMLRDSIRPDFKIYTGNDLAIDMVMYEVIICWDFPPSLRKLLPYGTTGGLRAISASINSMIYYNTWAVLPFGLSHRPIGIVRPGSDKSSPKASKSP